MKREEYAEKVKEYLSNKTNKNADSALDFKLCCLLERLARKEDITSTNHEVNTDDLVIGTRRADKGGVLGWECKSLFDNSVGVLDLDKLAVWDVLEYHSPTIQEIIQVLSNCGDCIYSERLKDSYK